MDVFFASTYQCALNIHRTRTNTIHSKAGSPGASFSLRCSCCHLTRFLLEKWRLDLWHRGNASAIVESKQSHCSPWLLSPGESGTNGLTVETTRVKETEVERSLWCLFSYNSNLRGFKTYILSTNSAGNKGRHLINTTSASVYCGLYHLSVPCCNSCSCCNCMGKTCSI